MIWPWSGMDPVDVWEISTGSAPGSESAVWPACQRVSTEPRRTSGRMTESWEAQTVPECNWPWISSGAALAWVSALPGLCRGKGWTMIQQLPSAPCENCRSPPYLHYYREKSEMHYDQILWNLDCETSVCNMWASRTKYVACELVIISGGVIGSTRWLMTV